MTFKCSEGLTSREVQEYQTGDLAKKRCRALRTHVFMSGCIVFEQRGIVKFIAQYIEHLDRLW